jgi:hypothetical protein
MRLTTCVMLTLICLAAPAAGQTPAFQEKVTTLVAQSSEQHAVAMICSPRGSDDFNKALNDWELRFGATLRVLQAEAQYSQDQILELRADFGPAAILPSNLYSRAELDTSCQMNADIYQLFVNNKMLPLHARIKRLIRQTTKY